MALNLPSSHLMSLFTHIEADFADEKASWLMKFRSDLFFPYPTGGRNRSHHSASGRGSSKRQGRRSRHRGPRLVPEDGRGVGADQEGHRFCGVALHPVKTQLGAGV